MTRLAAVLIAGPPATGKSTVPHLPLDATQPTATQLQAVLTHLAR